MNDLHELDGLEVLNSRPDLIAHVMATISDAMLILTPQMRVEVANRAFHQTFQTTPQMTNGQSLYELGSGEWDMPELRRLMHDVLPRQNPVLDYRVKRAFRATGPKTMLLSAVKLEQQGDLPERILLILRDVSALEAANETLNLHNHAMDEATNAIIITNCGQPDNPIVYVNQAFTAMTGYTAQEVVGKNCRFLQGPDTDGEAVANIRHALQTAQKTQQTLLNYRKDGSRFWNQLTLSPVIADGAPSHFIGVQADVTRLRDHMQRQEADNIQITALNDRLARAMQETHHRVKNNLQIVIAMLDMSVAEHPQTIPREEVATLTTMVRAMAAVHDVLTGQSRTDPLTTTTSLRQVLDKVTQLIRTTIGPRQLNVTAQDCPLAVRQSAAFAMLVNELVYNSIKHSQGNVEVNAYCMGREIVLEVCDEGPGFGEDFNPQQAAHTGLELVLTLVRHDLAGRITFGYVHPQEARGGLVRVTFAQEPARPVEP